MAQEDVTATDLGEHLRRRQWPAVDGGEQSRVRGGAPGLIPQGRLVEVGELSQIGATQQPADLVGVHGFDVELLLQQLDGVAGHVGGHLQSHHRTEPTA